MKYAVSACLLGVNCKYNGSNNLHQGLKEFLQDKEVLTVCPEVLGGLPSPRACCEIREGKVIDEHGKDVSEAFRNGAAIAAHKVKEFQADMVILQPRSPSCGNTCVYSGYFDGRLVSGRGIFAKLLHTENILAMDVDVFMDALEKSKEEKDR